MFKHIKLQELIGLILRMGCLLPSFRDIKVFYVSKTPLAAILRVNREGRWQQRLDTEVTWLLKHGTETQQSLSLQTKEENL